MRPRDATGHLFACELAKQLVDTWDPNSSVHAWAVFAMPKFGETLEDDIKVGTNSWMGVIFLMAQRWGNYLKCKELVGHLIWNLNPSSIFGRSMLWNSSSLDWCGNDVAWIRLGRLKLPLWSMVPSLQSPRFTMDLSLAQALVSWYPLVNVYKKQWKITHYFFFGVNPLFRLGHFPVRFLYVYQAG